MLTHPNWPLSTMKWKGLKTSWEVLFIFFEGEREKAIKWVPKQIKKFLEGIETRVHEVYICYTTQQQFGGVCEPTHPIYTDHHPL